MTVGMTVTISMLAVGLVCWPDPGVPGALDRVDVARARRDPGGPAGAGVRMSWILAGVVSVGVGMLAGAIPGACAGMVVLTGARLVGRRRRAGEQIRCCTQHLTAARALGRELRAGGSTAVAVDAVARSVPAGVAAPWRSIAVELAAPGGSERRVSFTGIDARVVDTLHRGLALVTRQGVPFADIADALATDLEDELQAGRLRTAQVAGPRLSGYVLAALPLFGVLMGSSMGVDPVAILLFTATGRILLLVGTVLLCLGLLWSDRLVTA